MDRLQKMSEDLGKAYVGTSGWKKPQWRGGFYPTGLVQRRELEYVSRQLTSLEINSTFHGLQRPGSFDTWRSETPDGFVFAIKGSQFVTRRPHLRNVRPALADFFASGVLRLDAKLGPLLWQLPAELTFQMDEVERFAALLPRSFDEAAALAAESRTVEWADTGLANRGIRHAVEIRNASFIDAGFIELMRANDIGIVHTNGPEHPHLEELTSDFVYARLGSGPDHHAEGYDDETLDEWAARIEGWLTGHPARDVFVYFNNPAGELPHTPFNALRLIERLSGNADRGSEGRMF
jgi:uncharacterized protein YecE (DUF72 family)